MLEASQGREGHCIGKDVGSQSETPCSLYVPGQEVPPLSHPAFWYGVWT